MQSTHFKGSMHAETWAHWLDSTFLPEEDTVYTHSCIVVRLSGANVNPGISSKHIGIVPNLFYTLSRYSMDSVQYLIFTSFDFASSKQRHFCWICCTQNIVRSVFFDYFKPPSPKNCLKLLLDQVVAWNWTTTWVHRCVLGFLKSTWTEFPPWHGNNLNGIVFCKMSELCFERVCV